MPRELIGERTELFRVKVIRQLYDGSSFVKYFGPYQTVGAAKGQANSIANEHERYTRLYPDRAQGGVAVEVEVTPVSFSVVEGTYRKEGNA